MVDLKITGLKMYICGNPPRNDLADSTRQIGEVGYIIADVCTDAGIHGIGMTYCESGNEAIKEFAEKTLQPLVTGMNPFDTENIWEKCAQYFRAVGRKGLAFLALSAVDIACWDIKGKVLNMPLYRLLGGNCADVPVYCSGGWTSYSEKQLVDSVLAAKDEGYSMIKIKVGVNGGNDLLADSHRVHAAREALGPDVRLAIDANNIWKSGTAIRFGKMVEDCGLEFFEEPVIADDIPGLVHCRNMLSIPIASGEHEYTRYGVRDLCVAGAADVVQFDATKCGGYTEALKMIAVTQAFNLQFAPHCMELAHMHLVAAASNGLTLECLDLFLPSVEHLFIDAPKPDKGLLHIPDRPGLGLELNMDWILEHSR